MGEFDTPVYEVPFLVGTDTVILRCGVLPPLLETTVLVTGKSGIIGVELCKKFQVFFLFRDWTLVID